LLNKENIEKERSLLERPEEVHKIAIKKNLERSQEIPSTRRARISSDHSSFAATQQLADQQDRASDNAQEQHTKLINQITI